MVIKIDTLDAEPPKRNLAGGSNRVRRQARGEPDLRRDHDLLAFRRIPLQPAADERLALSAMVSGHPGRIDVRSIDHRPARIDEGVEQGEAGLLVGGPAEDVSAKGE